jgi:hypothetical protein
VLAVTFWHDEDVTRMGEGLDMNLSDIVKTLRDGEILEVSRSGDVYVIEARSRLGERVCQCELTSARLERCLFDIIAETASECIDKVRSDMP